MSISKWIKHLDETDSGIKNEIININEELASIRGDIEELKNLNEESKNQPVFKQQQTVFNKQTAVDGVQTAVQTAVQTGFFNKLSTSEKVILMILVNVDSEMKLSYEDLATMTGKSTATIRGQINKIRQKFEGIIEEKIEKNNKKRLFVPDKIKGILLKRVKVRAKNRVKSIENS
jgi:hypothetical protein